MTAPETSGAIIAALPVTALIGNPAPSALPSTVRSGVDAVALLRAAQRQGGSR